MNRGWRFGIPMLCLLVASGCGDDSSNQGNNQTTEDAGVPDSGDTTTPTKEPTKPAPDAGKSDTGMGQAMKATTCADVKCNAPAVCSESGGKPHCACPDGWNDAKGDGSQCEDKDECAKDTDHQCGAHAHCKNEPGKYSCVCDGPAYEGDGKTCKCAKGYAEKDGLCLADDGGACEDDLDCVNGSCVSKICCAQACKTPNAECRSVADATCEDGHTCKYPVAKDGAACDDGDFCVTGSTCKDGACQKGTAPANCDDQNPCTDDSCDSTIGCKNQNNTKDCNDNNPCTQKDTCAAGGCVGSNPVDCKGQNDACNVGVCDPANGSCKKQPMGDGTSCDDSSTCTVDDKCAAGACSGANACGPNANTCTAGSPNTCACKDTFNSEGGLCVPDNNECDANPCSPNATCFDPSNDPNTVTCKCKPGYSGDGKTCYVTEPCKDNPCGEGRGSCTAGNAGTYTCACTAGYTAVAGTCVCDMNGTFAVRTRIESSWADDDTIEGGKGITYSWGLERHHYDATGKLSVETIPCGESNLDLCGKGVRVLGIPAEAYSQYVPLKAWERMGANPNLLEFELPNALPTKTYKSARYVTLQGITLSDPFGAWPATRKDIQGSTEFDGSAVNGASWRDTDADTFFGLTTYAVGPGGAPADGSATAPTEAFATTSQACPRNNTSADRSPYNYPPALEDLTPRRVKRFSSANRIISQFDGTIESCNRVSGKVVGDDGNPPKVEIRIGSCVRAGDNNTEVTCSSKVLDFLDGQKTTDEILSDTFVKVRVAEGTSCAQVRALTY